jgi:hypothetical protein
MSIVSRWKGCARLAVAAVLSIGGLISPATTLVTHAATTITSGDIIASQYTLDQVNEYTPTGTLVQTLMSAANGLQLPAGSAVDASGNLYVTDFNGNQILKRDATTGAVSVFSNNTILGNGHVFNSPESVAFNADFSRLYVSDANRNGPGGGINVLDAATGHGLAFFPLPSSFGSDGTGESDWLAFNASNVLFMTNESTTQGVMQVNQTTGDIVTPSLVSNLPNVGYALSFDKNGNLWLGDTNTILEYSSTGTLEKTITNSSFSTIFAAVFNPTGDQFFAGDLDTGRIFTYDLSGTLLNSFSAGGGISGLAVAGAKLPNTADTTPPSCALTNVIAGPPKQIQITVQDSGSGLAGPPNGIVVTEDSNATVSVPAYAAGTTSAIVVTATKIDQTLGSTIALQVTDVAGNVTNCDPALLTINRLTGQPASTTLTHIARAESQVRIQNDATQGAGTIQINVNGKTFTAAGLRNNEVRTLNVSSAMTAGNNNTITLTAVGQPGSSATVLVSN